MTKKIKILISLVFCWITMGCQNFAYYDPEKSHRGKTSFLNNYDNSPNPSVWKWYWERWTTPRPVEEPYEPDVLKVDVQSLAPGPGKISYTWLGHASALVQMGGLNILIDPIFSERASPFSFIGPKRLVPAPLQASELPSIDVVVISHGHYDHLDIPSLQSLQKRFSEKIQFLVPLGNKKILQDAGVKNVAEFDWWEEFTIGDVHFVLTPSQHWSARSLWDRNQTLWGGWYISTADFKFLYTGDTAYSRDFIDIHHRWGDMDLAMIPIGAYEPRWFMKKSHANPPEALQIHKDLGAKVSIGVHWGTFRLSDEPMLAPAQDLQKALHSEGMSSEEFRLLKHGETLHWKGGKISPP